MNKDLTAISLPSPVEVLDEVLQVEVGGGHGPRLSLRHARQRAHCGEPEEGMKRV